LLGVAKPQSLFGGDDIEITLLAEAYGEGQDPRSNKVRVLKLFEKVARKVMGWIQRGVKGIEFLRPIEHTKREAQMGRGWGTHRDP